jgi:hypothetical protein
MDTINLIQRTKARFDHFSSRKYLEEKYNNQLLIVSQNGTWKITPEFLSVLRNSPPETILLDSNNRPVKINTQLLLTQAQHLYDDVMTAWHLEFEELEKKR